MPITYREGDLFGAGNGVIAHGCNAKGKFGKGFALAMSKKLPSAKAQYELVHQRSGLVLGSVVWADCGETLVANCITQETYGNDGKRHVSYEAVASSMRALNTAARHGVPGTAFDSGFSTVRMPLIGADLAGGDWKVLSGIIEKELTNVSVTVHILADAKPEYRALIAK